MQGNTKRDSRNRRGFTLVELLVVIAIIAILIGVLLPALAGARESGYRSVSAGNLRSIATLMNVYANDYDTHFPMIPAEPRGAVGQSKNLPIDYLAANQSRYGGFAGYFSINQENAEGFKKARVAYWSWNRGAGKWAEVKPDGETDYDFQLRANIPMNAYIENPGDYQMLQNPADRLDGGENGPTLTPAVTPKTIMDHRDVCWHNISYMYIAGLNSTTPQLGLLGDETNAVDIGNDADASAWGFTNLTGTLRKKAADNGEQPGYRDVDNHGDAGGNFVYTDASVRWIGQSFGAKKDNNPWALGFEPHDQIFAEINLFLSSKGGASAVETVD